MIAMIAVAAATYAIDKPYSYEIPEGMSLVPGMRVSVPFGRGNRLTDGIVLAVKQENSQSLKQVAACLDSECMLSPYMLRLAAFLRERYFCTFYDGVRAMLPAGLWFQTQDVFALNPDMPWKQIAFRQSHAARILEHMEALGGTAKEQQLRQLDLPEEELHKAVSYLLRKKWITSQTDYLRRSRDKTEKIASLACSAEEAMAFAQSRPKSAAMQRQVLMTLCAIGSAAVKELCYHTGASAATVQRLESMGYVVLTEKPVLRCREIVPAKLEGELILNREQQEAFQGLCGQMQSLKPGAALLYGVTGSGKTAVYIQLIRQCLEQGKSAMLLVPEIALTPQLLGLMAAHFGQTVAVLHSSLGTAERYDQWKRVKNGQAKVVVGTRSAVFAPCVNPGLLILDEEQEHSYKSENSPRYCARDVALWRGDKEKMLVLLGSATPSVESMYHAKAGHYTLYRLKNRYNGKQLPRVEIVDMRQDLKEGNDRSLSYTLQESLRNNFLEGKQTILFLNRRGNSRALVCVDCRKSPECPRCSARLTYHSSNERLMCHYCSYSVPAPRRCPHCGGPVKRIGVGTQKVQQELLELCPDMTVDRMDTDTVSAVNTHEKILEHFQKEKVSVLVGTQMVAKGLNLPDVTLVGVLDADLGLYADSFRAAETTFNMLTQVVGRAGRGDAPGQAVIQTLVPEHQVITLAAKQDYDGFYNMEIRLRQLQQLPPFGDITQITFTGEDEQALVSGAVKFRDSLLACLQDPLYGKTPFTVLGPAPCAVPKINYSFRFRLTLRGVLDQNRRALIAHLLRQFAQDRSNRGICAFADVNGYE